VRVRALEKLPTIRAKLGSVIVLAVAMTIAIVYVLLGLALRNSFRDADLVELLRVAQARSTTGEAAPPDGASLATLRAGTFAWVSGPTLTAPPAFSGGVHVGVAGGVEYAAVPLRDGSGGMLYAVHTEPGFWPASAHFFLRFWWQLLAAGALAGGIALLIARWIARGMTQPLRDMASAAQQMERGEYGQRILTASRDEVGQLAVAFNRMSGELENLERLRRDLVANVSHELKTPISALRAHLENMIDGVEPADPETLQAMLAQSERLGRLVDQLLELSRLESGDLPLRREPVRLGPLISQVAAEIEVTRGTGGTTLEIDIEDDLPPVYADPERIHQVLFNLLDNALGFTAAGGQVTVSAERGPHGVGVAVADTGPGIAAEHLPRVFDRFYRVDSARSRDDGGTGIGLAIARSVVEAHGGRIWAESEPGHGSIFRFELPTALVVDDPGARASQASRPRPEPSPIGSRRNG
jgi:signal transduction histidine kinase